MKLQTKQSLQQRLLLAPNITMALEILRMPTMELQTFLERQLEDNPLLELEAVEEENERTSDDSPAEEAQTNGLDEEWLSHWRTGSEQETPDEEDNAGDRIIDQRFIMIESLQDLLHKQLGCQRLSVNEQQLGELVIQHLNDQGYFEGSLEEFATEAGVTADEAAAMLRLIQRFDPPGVGARNLRECLMIQLEQSQAEGTLAYLILKDHFPLFLKNRLSAITRATGASAEQVAKACAALKQLNPKPGRAFSGDLPPSVVPDLVIRHREKHYDVELNDQELPHIIISRTYYRMLKDPRTPSDAKEFLEQKFRKASWIIKAIDERNATLLSIARCLISLQHDFIVEGPKALKPLTQVQVADLVGRHASTVSRAIAGKTIDTPYGVFRLERFFASGVPQAAESEGVSDAKIKGEIQRLVAEEDPYHPLSDAALTEQLAQRNITVARRTIAKYRTALRILPAHLRRHNR